MERQSEGKEDEEGEEEEEGDGARCLQQWQAQTVKQQRLDGGVFICVHAERLGGPRHRWGAPRGLID